MSSVLDVRTIESLDFVGPEKFPHAPYQNAALYFDAYMGASARAAASIDPQQLELAARVLTEAYLRGATVFSCGNGGSASLANHFQCDHVKGIRTKTDLSPRVVSLSSSVELLTAIANDIEFEDVFAYQLQSQARSGDVLIAISSSGRSANIVRVVAWACALAFGRSHSPASTAEKRRALPMWQSTSIAQTTGLSRIFTKSSFTRWLNTFDSHA